MVDTHFRAIWESVADAVPDAIAGVQGARRYTWREYEQRAARLAQCFLDTGLAPHARVGMFPYNSPEYCEANFAAMKMRGVGINYRHLDQELAYLLDSVDVEALVYHRSLADRVARVCQQMPGLGIGRITALSSEIDRKSIPSVDGRS